MVFTCHKDFQGNPFQDCLNSMAAFCRPNNIEGNFDRISTCKAAVDNITLTLNPNWQRVRRDCGQWTFGRIRPLFSSDSCANANDALRATSYYVLSDGSIVYVTRQLTDSVKVGLWDNAELRDK